MSERPGEAEAVEAARLAAREMFRYPPAMMARAVAAAYPIIAAAVRADEQAVRADERERVAQKARAIRENLDGLRQDRTHCRTPGAWYHFEFHPGGKRIGATVRIEVRLPQRLDHDDAEAERFEADLHDALEPVLAARLARDAGSADCGCPRMVMVEHRRGCPAGADEAEWP